MPSLQDPCTEARKWAPVGLPGRMIFKAFPDLSICLVPAVYGHTTLSAPHLVCLVPVASLQPSFTNVLHALDLWQRLLTNRRPFPSSSQHTDILGFLVSFQLIGFSVQCTVNSGRGDVFYFQFCTRKHPEAGPTFPPTCNILNCMSVLTGDGQPWPLGSPGRTCLPWSSG